MKKTFIFILLFFATSCATIKTYLSGVRYVSPEKINRLVGKDHAQHKHTEIGSCAVVIRQTGRSYRFHSVTKQECTKITKSVQFIMRDMERLNMIRSMRIVKK